METPEEISVLSILLPLAGIVFIIAVGVVLLNQQFQKNLFRQQLGQEELKNVHQRELLSSSIRMQEEERKRIAQDLHDELGATLSIARMHLLQLQTKHAEASPESIAAFGNIRGLIENALSGMRRISHQLMPPQLETFGLVNALEAVARQVNETGGMQITITAAQNLPECGWLVKVGLYRINMELLNNTIRHAGADRVTIDISFEAGLVVSSYSDNGKGLPVDFAGKGLGTKGIEGRAASLGGSLELGNKSGGFYAIARIPPGSM
jgi:signal transduction histidine kinase